MKVWMKARRRLRGAARARDKTGASSSRVAAAAGAGDCYRLAMHKVPADREAAWNGAAGDEQSRVPVWHRQNRVAKGFSQRTVDVDREPQRQ
jgi:hypothetical protein